MSLSPEGGRRASTVGRAGGGEPSSFFLAGTSWSYSRKNSCHRLEDSGMHCMGAQSCLCAWSCSELGEPLPSVCVTVTSFKQRVQWFLVFSQSCATIIAVNVSTFLLVWKEILSSYLSAPPTHTPQSPIAPSPWQTLVYFLSVKICLFWTFYVNRITQ